MSAKPIVVKIDFVDLVRFGNAIHAGRHTLERLQRAGIPAVGVLFLEHVSSGTITISGEPMFDESITYTWTE